MQCYKCGKKIHKDKKTKKYIGLVTYIYNNEKYNFCSKKCRNTM